MAINRIQKNKLSNHTTIYIYIYICNGVLKSDSLTFFLHCTMQLFGVSLAFIIPLFGTSYTLFFTNVINDMPINAMHSNEILMFDVYWEHYILSMGLLSFYKTPRVITGVGERCLTIRLFDAVTTRVCFLWFINMVMSIRNPLYIRSLFQV